MVLKLITTREMRILETNSVGLGVSTRMLMEAAGKSVADLIASRVKPSRDLRVVVLVGKGGNGGDGLVAARYLTSYGYRVEVIPSHSLRELEHPDAKYNMSIVARLPSITIHNPGDPEPINGASIIVDALLGTGVKGVLRDPIKRLVEASNGVNAVLKVAIDTPTGLDPDTGEVHGVAFKADVTVTMHDLKPGLLKRPELVGEIVVANIGIPIEAKLYVGPGDVIYGRPIKPPTAHKGMGGKVMVIGGSKYYTGAPALVGEAALASGADLAFVVVPEVIKPVVSGYSEELIVLGVPGNSFSEESIKLVSKYYELFKPHVIVFGNGLSREPEPIEFAEKFIEWAVAVKAPLVIDADALRAIKYGVTKLSWRAVITPHRGEFKALTGVELTENPYVDYRYVTNASKVLESTVLLKAPIDIIAQGDDYRFNKTGNPGMTVGGTGDVLAGIVGAVYAYTGDPYMSASIAAYLNGLAGDYLLRVLGENPLPTKIVNVLPRVINEVLEVHLRTYGITLNSNG